MSEAPERVWLNLTTWDVSTEGPEEWEADEPEYIPEAVCAERVRRARRDALVEAARDIEDFADGESRIYEHLTAKLRPSTVPEGPDPLDAIRRCAHRVVALRDAAAIVLARLDAGGGE